MKKDPFPDGKDYAARGKKTKRGAVMKQIVYFNSAVAVEGGKVWKKGEKAKDMPFFGILIRGKGRQKFCINQAGFPSFQTLWKSGCGK